MERSRNVRVIGKAEKPSPYSPIRKADHQIHETVRRTNENATRQHGSENTAMKMDETWQMVTNQRQQ